MIIKNLSAAALLLASSTASAAEAVTQTQDAASQTGVSAIWILANLSYAGMRAQNNPHTGWRLAAFLFGFSGTLLSHFLVVEGGERAYGVDIPRRQ